MTDPTRLSARVASGRVGLVGDDADELTVDMATSSRRVPPDLDVTGDVQEHDARTTVLMVTSA
ncbi:hypothetical protein GCM10009813_13530 [Brevibacterium marinum]